MRGGKLADRGGMVANYQDKPLPTEDAVSSDWIIEQLSAELIRQEPVLGHDFIAIGRMSRITKGPEGMRTVFFGLRCECDTSAIVSFEVAVDKARSQVMEALPQTGQRFFSQLRTFRQMPCSAHNSFRIGSLNQT
jgi:hypothetical protein